MTYLLAREWALVTDEVWKAFECQAPHNLNAYLLPKWILAMVPGGIRWHPVLEGGASDPFTSGVVEATAAMELKLAGGVLPLEAHP